MPEVVTVTLTREELAALCRLLDVSHCTPLQIGPFREAAGVSRELDNSLHNTLTNAFEDEFGSEALENEARVG